MRVGTRLMIVATTLAALMLAIGVLTFDRLDAGQAQWRAAMRAALQPMQRLSRIQEGLSHNRLVVALAVGRGDEGAAAQGAREIEAAIDRIDDLWSLHSQGAMEPRQRELAQAFAAARAQYVRQALRPVMAALGSGEIELARRLQEDTVTPLFTPVQAALSALQAQHLHVAHARLDAAGSRLDGMRLAVYGLAALAFVLLAGWAWRLSRRLDDSIARAVAAARAIADGRLDAPAAPATVSGDACPALLHDLDAARTRVAASVAEAREAGRTLVADGVALQHGGQALASGWEAGQQALAELTATLGALETRLQQRSRETLRAASLSVDALDKASAGGAVLGRLIEAIRAAEGHARRLSSTTGAIDSIALQTNVLALDVTGEAERAGESGSRFEGVAAQMRELARCCKAAAHEAGLLIGMHGELMDAAGRLADEAGEAVGTAHAAARSCAAANEALRQAVETADDELGRLCEELDRVQALHGQAADKARDHAATARRAVGRANRLIEVLQDWRLPVATDASAGARDTGAGVA